MEETSGRATEEGSLSQMSQNYTDYNDNERTDKTTRSHPDQSCLSSGSWKIAFFPNEVCLCQVGCCWRWGCRHRSVQEGLEELFNVLWDAALQGACASIKANWHVLSHSLLKAIKKAEDVFCRMNDDWNYQLKAWLGYFYLFNNTKNCERKNESFKRRLKGVITLFLHRDNRLHVCKNKPSPCKPLMNSIIKPV